MCRVLKVLLVAPSDRQLELRRRLSSVSYEIVATVPPGELTDVSADVAVVWQPGPGTVRELQDADLKVVAVGGQPEGADMALDPDDLGSFKDRVWDLFRP